MKKSLGMAYAIKKKNDAKKPMYAKGGRIPDQESAKTESRPMPETKVQDSAMVARNSGDKALPMSKMLDRPTEAQAISNNGRMVKPIKHPSMVQSPVFKIKLRDQEDDLITSEKPEMYAKGGMINDEVSMHAANEDQAVHPAGLESDDDQMAPHEEEFMSSKMPAYAEGGRIEPMDEEEMEHYDSMAAAIMAKRERQMNGSSDSDIDSQEHKDGEEGMSADDHTPQFAKGGPIKSHPSIYSDDSSEVDLSRNADEDANEEDQVSFNALRKENYSETDALNKLDQPEDSNEHGDEREMSSENKQDKVDRIMSKMAKSKKFK